MMVTFRDRMKAIFNAFSRLLHFYEGCVGVIEKCKIKLCLGQQAIEC